MTTRYEFKVAYRRDGWQPGRSKSRVFAFAIAARRFIERLVDGGRYGPVADVRLYRREVGDWTEVLVDG